MTSGEGELSSLPGAFGETLFVVFPGPCGSDFREWCLRLDMEAEHLCPTVSPCPLMFYCYWGPLLDPLLLRPRN